MAGVGWVKMGDEVAPSVDEVGKQPTSIVAAARTVPRVTIREFSVAISTLAVRVERPGGFVLAAISALDSEPLFPTTNAVTAKTIRMSVEAKSTLKDVERGGVSAPILLRSLSMEMVGGPRLRAG